jgi:hypothetical protein
MNKLVLGVAALALSTTAASAQWVYPGYGYAPYGYSRAHKTLRNLRWFDVPV